MSLPVMLEALEKISAFILQTTGSLSSWQSVIANVSVFVVAILFRNSINNFYATILLMDNPIVTFATWDLVFYGYIAFHKTVSAVFAWLSRHKNSQAAKQKALLHKETIKLSILNLSRNETAILKFLLKQEAYAAWLPNEDSSVILLESKNIIRNVDHTRTKIVDFWHGSSRNLSCSLYQISDDVQSILTDMHGELSKNWRNVKANHSLADLQKL